LPELIRQIPGVEQAVEQSAQPLGKVFVGTQMAQRHEAAKRTLVELGRPRDKVEQMPPLQVALLHAGLDVERVLDEAEKWNNFPQWQAAPQLEALGKKVRSSRGLLPEAPALPASPALVPAISKTFNARTRLDRQFAALQCVEAVRLYAAAHGGKRPATLAEIKEVPIPLDPGTGKQFEYETNGDRAFLLAPIMPGEFASLVPNYELILRR
jgi:hypothetical protein